MNEETEKVKIYISENFALSTVALSSSSYSNFISLARHLLNETSTPEGVSFSSKRINRKILTKYIKSLKRE